MAIPAALTVLLYPVPASLANVSREIPLYVTPKALVALNIAQERINYRVSRIYTVNRKLAGFEPKSMDTIFKKGRWEGGLYIYFSSQSTVCDISRELQYSKN